MHLSVATRRGAPSGRRRVGVLVPCYNYGRFLRACVTSVLTQPGVDARVVIIDDASTDGSADVARQLADEDQRVTAITHPRNLGHIATYNEGLAAIEGDYVTLLSADDMLTPGSLGRSVAVLEAHPRVGLVYGHPLSFQGDGDPPTAATSARAVTVWPGEAWIRGRCRQGTNPIYSPEVLLRRSVQQEIGSYDAGLPHSADMEMWLRAAMVADVARLHGPDQAFRRIHGSNMSETTFGGVLPDLAGRRAAFGSFFAEAGSSLGDAPELHERARRALAREALAHACVAFAAGADAFGDECLEFAAATYRGAPGLLDYREAQRRSLPSSRQAGLAGRVHDVRLDIRGRGRWRMWRHAGL